MPGKQMFAIDWEVFEKIQEMMSAWQNIWMTKYNARIGVVRVNMVRRRHTTENGCPNCGMPENVDHIFTCQSHVRTKATMQSQEETSNLFLSDTILREVVLELMHYLRQQVFLNFCEGYVEEVT